MKINPLTPSSDKHVTSPYHNYMLSTRLEWEYSNWSGRSCYLDLQYRSKISEPPNALSTRGLEEVNALVLFR